MTALPPSFLAATGVPLFGSMPLALAVVLSAVALFTAAVAMLGRWLAATHPDSPSATPQASAQSPVAAPVPHEIEPEVVAAIVAAVFATEGSQARIAAIHPPAVSVEALMQQWSLEGRRQIYSSHKVR
ncbi:OadG family transporter subunit [Nibricoccus sp. IMCC34717]|uniref:OadG family transporter subunit n=1 Tax=Nibricoccus sp. IMCC34717 TaxID=3034021 RepID=UPI0038505AD1